MCSVFWIACANFCKLDRASVLRIGIEHERFGFDLKTLRPMKYEQIAELLNGIAEGFGWDKNFEGGNIIALKQV